MLVLSHIRDSVTDILVLVWSSMERSQDDQHAVPSGQCALTLALCLLGSDELSLKGKQKKEAGCALKPYTIVSLEKFDHCDSPVGK